jgi:hypothetical protein
MTAQALHAAQSPRQAQYADTVRHHFGEKGSYKINANGEEGFQREHASMMALTGDSVKKGKHGCGGAVPPIFPVFAELEFGRRLSSTMAQPTKQTESISIGELYPHLAGEELEVAEANLRRYIAVMVRIYERVRAEQGPEAATRLAYGDLTTSESCSTIPDERSNNVGLNQDH